MRDLSDVDFVYLWADGILVNIRLEEHKLCLLVRRRTKITRRPGSRTAGLAVAVKLIMAAQDRRRAVNAPHLVALVRAGAIFVNGKLVERTEDRQLAGAPADAA